MLQLSVCVCVQLQVATFRHDASLLVCGSAAGCLQGVPCTLPKGKTTACRPESLQPMLLPDARL